MQGSSPESALDRIDSALARLERSLARIPSGDAKLAARHTALKESVAQALDEIDALIAGQRQ